MSHRACVVVGDVVRSRSVEDRERLREALLDGLDRVNAALSDRLLAPFATLKGVDELGGVLNGLAGVERALRRGSSRRLLAIEDHLADLLGARPMR